MVTISGRNSTSTYYFAVLFFTYCIAKTLSEEYYHHERWKRNDNNCKPAEFRCNSGECIRQSSVCDGKRDCRDSSDETSETCANAVIPFLTSNLHSSLSSYILECPPNAFRCYSGLCIEGAKRCDGKEDCPDKADEVGCSAGGSVLKQCKTDQFQCVSGSCINGVLVCDGKADCDDQSDETIQLCSGARCSDMEFKCTYGGCIDRAGVCDGLTNCVDASDESKCHQPLPPSGGARCTLPEQPQNGQYDVGGSCEGSACTPGSSVPRYTVLLFKCKDNLKLYGPQIVLCDQGQWSSPFPVCEKVFCPPLVVYSREFACEHNGEFVNCSQRMQPGTRVTVKCNQYHTHQKELADFVISCKDDGNWTREVHECYPICGLPIPKGVPFITGGRPAGQGEFPWGVAIYNNMFGTMQHVCSGNIVSRRVIVTAAHCFWNTSSSTTADKKFYRILAGKYYRSWDTRNDNVQEISIGSIVLYSLFQGNLRNYDNDIAVVITSAPIIMNAVIRPICLDINQVHKINFVSGVSGAVAGWGITENDTYAEVVHTANLPYVTLRECIENVPPTFVQHLTSDKFCAGDIKKGINVCAGDSGGGYAVKFERKYYLMGVVSVGGIPESGKQCNPFHYTTFTEIYAYNEFLKKYIDV